MSAPWIDISTPLRSGMAVWPGDPEVTIQRVLDLDHGDAINLTAASFGLHSGTHIDAPLHYLAGGTPIDRMPPEAAIGAVRVLELPGNLIGAAELERHAIAEGERILLKGGGKLTPEGAEHLAARRIRAVGIDALTIGDDDAHRVLLSAGIWIIEGLDLSAVTPGAYELLCLPLRVEGAEGAPARALLRRADR